MPRPKKYKSKIKFKLKTESIQSLVALACFALAGLTLLSFIGQAAGAGTTLQVWIDQGVGWTAFLMPVLLLSLGLVLTRIKWGVAKLHVFIGLVISTVMLASLLQPISHVFSPLSSLDRAQAGMGGGYLGFTIWEWASELLSPFGAVFLLGLGWLAGLLVLLNTSLTSLFSVSGQVAEGGKNVLEKVKTKKPTEDRPEPAFTVNEAGAPKPVAVPAAKQVAEPLNSTRVLANEAQDVIWEYPPISLLGNTSSKGDGGDLKGTAAILERTLDSFGIQARVVNVNVGPTVTQYALELASGTKVSKITTLSNDLALAVAAKSGAVRVEAPIPGTTWVGIEIPNQKSAVVGLRSILESEQAKAIKSRLLLPLGQGVSGHAEVADLTKMPHLLVAGSTGSGKSIQINAFIASLLFKNSPSELKLILVDPKFVELTGYNGIPHLLTPVITENDKVVSALKWATGEMDRRYRLLATAGARNIEGYNELSGFQALPYIVIIIDELSDLMMTAPAEVEDAIVRIAQKARAVGIHLILATQRPSSDIITGLIKANIPARVAFNVSSNVDSRVILDQPGAEKLLGKGDMLYMAPDAAKPSRIQGNWVKDEEIAKLLDFIKKQGVEPEYAEEVTSMATGMSGGSGGKATSGEDQDPMFLDAVRVVYENNTASSSLLQRRLKLGYARAARILDELERAGVVGPADGSKPRDVIAQTAAQVLTGGEGGEA